jgi:hypothetical protein
MGFTAAEKLIWRGTKCQGKTSVVPQMPQKSRKQTTAQRANLAGTMKVQKTPP